MQGSGDNRQLTSSCAHGYYHASGPCRLACTYTAAERAVPTAVSCVRAAMSDGPYRRVLMGHRRANSPCHVVRTGTATERAVPTAVSCVRAAMTDSQCRHVLSSSIMVLGLCWMHRHCCGAGRADRRLVHASGDDRRPMTPCADRQAPSRQWPMPSWMHEHLCGAGHAERRLVCASGDDRRPMPACAHRHRRADGPCRSACWGTAAERAVPTAVLCERAVMTDCPCCCVLIGTVVPTAHAVFDA